VLAWLVALDARDCFITMAGVGACFGLYVAYRIAVGRPIEWSGDFDLWNDHSPRTYHDPSDSGGGGCDHDRD
jgi:hypothetical protein